MHGVSSHFKSPRYEGLDLGEVKDLRHERGVVCHAVDDVHDEVMAIHLEGLCPDDRQVDLEPRAGVVLLQLGRQVVNVVSDAGRGWTCGKQNNEMVWEHVLY